LFVINFFFFVLSPTAAAAQCVQYNIVAVDAWFRRPKENVTTDEQVPLGWSLQSLIDTRPRITTVTGLSTTVIFYLVIYRRVAYGAHGAVTAT